MHTETHSHLKSSSDNLCPTTDYKSLSQSLLKFSLDQFELEKPNLSRENILGSETKINRWLSGTTSVRASAYFYLLAKQGKCLSSIRASITAPIDVSHQSQFLTEVSISKNFIQPILKHLRRDLSLKETAQKLQLENSVNFHHWETGKRDIPLATFLKCIDSLSPRIGVFCESIGFIQDLSSWGITNAQAPNFSEQFFKFPWTPTVFLAIQTDRYKHWDRHCDKLLASQLGLDVNQIHQALHILSNLQIIQYKENRYETRKGSYYAPPSLTSEILDRLHLYWFDQACDLYQMKGYSKIDQATMSYKSIEKIEGWIKELREKIRLEVKNTEPETIVHMNWQIIDLMSKRNSRTNNENSH